MASVHLDSVPAISERQRRTLLITDVVGHGVKHVFNSGLYVILPELKSSLDLSNAQVGVLSTARNISGGLANLPAGYLADRYPGRHAEVLMVTLIGTGAAALVLGLTSSYLLAVIAVSVLVGIQSFWHPTALSALSREFANRRGFAIALHGTGGSVGEAVGPLVVGLLLTFATYRTILTASVVPAVIAGLLVWFAVRDLPMGSPGASGFFHYVQGLRSLLANPRLLLVLIAAGGFASAQSIVVTFLPIYLRETGGVSTATVGFYLFLAQVTGIATQPLMGWLSDHWGRKAVIVPGMVMLGAANYGLSVAEIGLPFVAVVLVLGAFLYSLMSMFIAAAVDQSSTGVQATTVSLVFGVATAIAGVAPGLAGLLADTAGVAATFVCAAGVSLVTAILALVSPWQRA